MGIIIRIRRLTREIMFENFDVFCGMIKKKT